MGFQPIPVATATADESNLKNKYSYQYGSAAMSDPSSGIHDGIIKGEVQQPAFRDGIYAVFFWSQVVVVFTLSFMYITGRIEVDWQAAGFVDEGRRLSSAVGPDGEEEEFLNWYPLLWGSVSALLIAPILTVGMMSVLAEHGETLIQFSLYFSIGLNVFLAVLCAIAGFIMGVLATGIGALVTYLYARAIWDRIPLAAANLKTGVAALQTQLGVAFLGFTSLPFYTIWVVTWIYFFAATISTPFMLSQATEKVGDNGTTQQVYSSTWYCILFLMLLSFYWTLEVIGNTVQTTVAGSVGTFWFVPEEASGCCSQALSSSLYRSLTYSFGSICMGSLLVAIIQAARSLVRQAEEQARRDGDGLGSILLCLAQCILSLLEAFAEYFNKWAFIYVGLYGYSYLEAGKNVITLFQQRGWTTIISDNLTARVLGMMSFTIGLITGLLAAILAGILGVAASSPEGAVGGMALGSLLIAFFVGMMVASIVMTVINSAVDTVIVLFAEAPMELQQNHPVLSEAMNRTWSSCYPDIFTPTVPTVVV